MFDSIQIWFNLSCDPRLGTSKKRCCQGSEQIMFVCQVPQHGDLRLARPKKVASMRCLPLICTPPKTREWETAPSSRCNERTIASVVRIIPFRIISFWIWANLRFFACSDSRAIEEPKLLPRYKLDNSSNLAHVFLIVNFNLFNRLPTTNSKCQENSKANALRYMHREKNDI